MADDLRGLDQLLLQARRRPVLIGSRVASVRRKLPRCRRSRSVREHAESDESLEISAELPPMWTTTNRARYDPNHVRYPSDLTDEEWALIGAAHPAGEARSQATVNVREIASDRGAREQRWHYRLRAWKKTGP
jgi:hypothetical protein